ncbi:hypothetical protein ACH5RR_010194 [Cinchona calisaya]|uniref:Leucine-rich repeat-containing N-terminal plant-type domain-containing protein n=1 Tax=Cinchona calisaya TaxID=153742 RepID=A0ABD3AI32_9GENT
MELPSPTLPLAILTGISPHPLFCMLLIFSFSLHASSAILLSNDTDKLALLEFKSWIIDDTLGVMSSWNDSLHFCQWVGVSCSREHQRVTGLNLKRQKLVGTMSPFIANLSFLHFLDLSDNSFQGVIPEVLGGLSMLQNLNLSFNFIIGQIPGNLSRCSNLINLVLDHNYLVQEIPPELGMLSKLTRLYLKNNNITGTFPASIGNLTSLQSFICPITT